MVDETKLNAFIGKMLGDLGGAFSVPMVRMGDKLGFYTALKEQPMTPKELAAKTKVAERYAREWLSHQAASGYLEYDAASGQFALPPEQAMVFADVDSPVYLQGAFDLAVAMIENQPKVEAAFRSGKGVGWATRRRASSAPLVASSAPATITILSGLGCRRWTASPPSSKAAPKWRTLVVVMVFRPSSWRRRSRNRFSSATTFIPFYSAGSGPRRAARGDGEHEVRSGHGGRFSRQGSGSRDFLRLPARHGRSGRRCPPCAQDAEGRWELDDRRAGGGRSTRGQSQSGEPDVLRRLDHDLRADLARSTGRSGVRSAGGIWQAILSDYARRIWQSAQGDRDAVQHDPGGATLIA